MPAGVDELEIAVKARWAARSLDTDVPGGIVAGRLAPNPTDPYCVFNIVSAPVFEQTSGSSGTGSDYRDVNMQFKIFGQGKTVAKVAAKKVLAAFLNFEPALTNGITIIRKFQLQDGFPVDEGKDEWSWTLLMDAQLRVPVVLDPA
jgi:hypothetical protein